MAANSRLTRELVEAIKLPPKQAIAYFRALGYPLSDARAGAALERARSRAFSIANITSAKVVQAVYDELEQGLAEGITQEAFLKSMYAKLAKLGYIGDVLPPYRMKLVYRAAMQTSYNAGRYVEQMANSEAQPLLMRVEVLDEHTRPTHVAVHQVVYPANDAYWQNNYPPYLHGKFEYGCRGRVRAVSEARFKVMQEKNPALSIRHTTTVLAGASGLPPVFSVKQDEARQLADIRDPDLRAAAYLKLNERP